MINDIYIYESNSIWFVAGFMNSKITDHSKYEFCHTIFWWVAIKDEFFFIFDVQVATEKKNAADQVNLVLQAKLRQVMSAK